MTGAAQNQKTLAPSSWAREQCARAFALFRDGHPHQALDLVEEILRRSPGEKTAIELGAQVAEHAAILPSSARYLAMLMSAESGSQPRRRALGHVLIKAGRHGAAADVLEPLLSNDPVGSGALADYLAAVDRLPATNEAGRLLDRLAEGVGTPPRITEIHKIADALARAGRIDSALDWLDRDWQGRLTPQEVAFYKGRLLYNNGRRLQSEAFFDQIVVWNDSRQFDARLFHARVAKFRGDDDATFERYMAVYALSRQNAECLSFFGRHYLKYRDFEAAERYIQRLEEVEPKNQQLPWLRSTLAYRKDRPEEAIAIFKRAIADAPDLVENYGHLSDLFTNLGHFDQAAETLEAGTARHPESMFLLVRILVCAERRRIAPAEQLVICDRVLSVDASSELALRRKASILLGLGRRVEAMDAFVEGSRHHPGSIHFWRSAAQLVARSRNPADLDQLLTRARAHFGDGGADASANLAYILEATGKGDEAAALAEHGLESATGATIARQVIARQSVEEGDFARAWAQLLELQKPADRPIDTVRLFAQVAAAFHSVRPTQIANGAVEPIQGRFPDLVYQEAVQRLPVLDAAQCRPVIFEVTSTLAAGGAERQVILTCNALTQLRPDLAVELIAEDLTPALKRDFFLPRLDQSRVPVRELKALHTQGAWRELLAERPELRAHIRTLSSLPPQAQRIALPLYVLLVRERPQVVHLWQDMIAVAGGLAAVLAGVPRIVFGIRSTRPIEFQRARPFFHGAYRAMLQRPGISMIGNSFNGARDYEDWLGLPEGTVGVVPNACDLAAIQANVSPDESRRIRTSLGIPADAPVLGGVMRCSFEKRPELWTGTAIELARRDPRFHGILVGDGPMMPELIDQVRQEGLADRIHFVGRHTPIEPWMQAMDVLFLSSKTEGLPNVLIEAQALGVAAATMRVGGAPEAVSEGHSAIVLDEAPVPQLAAQLGELLSSVEWRSRFAQAGPAFIRERFSPEAVVRQLGEVYR